VHSKEVEKEGPPPRLIGEEEDEASYRGPVLLLKEGSIVKHYCNSCGCPAGMSKKGVNAIAFGKMK
jgi:hypothetical protein